MDVSSWAVEGEVLVVDLEQRLEVVMCSLRSDDIFQPVLVGVS